MITSVGGVSASARKAKLAAVWQGGDPCVSCPGFAVVEEYEKLLAKAKFKMPASLLKRKALKTVARPCQYKRVLEY